MRNNLYTGNVCHGTFLSLKKRSLSNGVLALILATLLLIVTVGLAIVAGVYTISNTKNVRITSRQQTTLMVEATSCTTTGVPL